MKLTDWISDSYHKRWWLAPLTIFVIWRLGLEMFARGALAVSPEVIVFWRDNPNPPLWARWDSGWYYSIVHYGYSFHSGKMSNVSFFPLYPLLWRALSAVLSLPSYVAGIIVANILAGGSFILIYRWAEQIASRVVARGAVLALAFFPTSFFLISAYSESTLLFLTALTLLWAQRQKWTLAALAAGLGSAARPVGIFLVPLLVGLWIVASKKTKPRVRDLAAIVILGSIGLMFYSLYLWRHVGEPFAWFHSQVSAGHNFVAPYRLFFAYIKNILTFGPSWRIHFVELAAVAFVVAHLKKLWRLNPSYALFACLPILLLSFSNTFTSIQRFVLTIVPLFVVVAQRGLKFWIAYGVITLPLLLYACYRFVTNQWVA